LEQEVFAAPVLGAAISIQVTLLVAVIWYYAQVESQRPNINKWALRLMVAITCLLTVYLLTAADVTLLNRQRPWEVSLLSLCLLGTISYQLIRWDEGRFTRDQEVRIRDGVEIFDDRLDLMKHYGDYFLSAEKRVLIVGETLVTFIQYPRFKDVVKSTVSRGVKVDVVLMSDKCPSLEERAFELGEGHEEMRASQQAAISGWKSLMKFVESSHFNVFLIDYHPKMFIFHIDERVYFQPYPFGAYGTELPCMLAHSSSSAYDDIVRIEEKLMNASHKLVKG
jgi:hypothetical protein